MMKTTTSGSAYEVAPPGGHYSHAVTANGFVFVSGELPIAPDGTKLNEAPFERPVEDVREDVRQGYVSVQAAAQRYGVVVDAETFAVDQAATDKLRART